jgi:hypothetical protein
MLDAVSFIRSKKDDVDCGVRKNDESKPGDFRVVEDVDDV